MRDKNQSKVDNGFSDQELIARILAGDQESFKILISRYWEQYFFQALRIVHNSADAEEVVQQGIMKIYQNLRTLHDVNKFGSWGNTCIRNLCFSYLKKEERERAGLAEYAQIKQIDQEQKQTQGDPRTTMEHRRNQEKMLKVIARLPQKYREVAVLSFEKDLTCSEIAQRLQIAVGTVEVRLSRARKIILKQLGGVL